MMLPSWPLKQQQRPVCVAPCLGRPACHICPTSLPASSFHLTKFRERDLAATPTRSWGDRAARGTQSGPITAEPLIDLVQSEDLLPASHGSFAPGLFVSSAPLFLWFTSKISFQPVCALCDEHGAHPRSLFEVGSYQLLGRAFSLSLVFF